MKIEGPTKNQKKYKIIQTYKGKEEKNKKQKNQQNYAPPKK